MAPAARPPMVSKSSATGSPARKTAASSWASSASIAASFTIRILTAWLVKKVCQAVPWMAIALGEGRLAMGVAAVAPGQVALPGGFTVPHRAISATVFQGLGVVFAGDPILGKEDREVGRRPDPIAVEAELGGDQVFRAAAASGRSPRAAFAAGRPGMVRVVPLRRKTIVAKALGGRSHIAYIAHTWLFLVVSC